MQLSVDKQNVLIDLLKQLTNRIDLYIYFSSRQAVDRFLCTTNVHLLTQPIINLPPLIAASYWPFSKGPQQHSGKSNRWPIKMLANILGILHMI